MRHILFRESLTDGVRELVGNFTSTLVRLLQAKQTSSIPYQTNLMSLIERFNRTRKDIVSLTVNEEQDDWDVWLQAAVYAYKSAEHTSMSFTPNELMTGR